MSEQSEFKPTNLIQHRYLDPKVLIKYVKTLPDKFKDEQITVKVFHSYDRDFRSDLNFRSGCG